MPSSIVQEVKASVESRAVESSLFNLLAQALRIGFVLVRSVVLTRLLDPEAFGVYTLALSTTTITFSLANALLTGPFLHHAPESDGDVGASSHFLLNLGASGLLAAVLSGFAVLFVEPEYRSVYFVLIIVGFLYQLTVTQQTLLTRRVLFRRIALNGVVTAFLTTVMAISLAVCGWGVWSLVSIQVVASVVALVMFCLVRPPWRMCFLWSTRSIRYFLSFGSKTFVAGVLGVVLDRLDDLWVGYALGPVELGFYSRAYEFATYPREILSKPLNQVAAGTYAELKNDRSRLSRAFVGYNKLLIGMGVAFSGMLALAAPEVITLAIGERWWPVVFPFRLMLLFSMLDPVKITIASVLVAVGKPGQVGLARIVQFGVLVLGLLSMGRCWGIVGVALAVDLMLLVGIVVLLGFASRYVDFSARSLLGVPLLGVALGLAIGWGGAIFLPITSMLGRALLKALMFLGVYGLVVYLFDRSFWVGVVSLAKKAIGRER